MRIKYETPELEIYKFDLSTTIFTASVTQQPTNSTEGEHGGGGEVEWPDYGGGESPFPFPFP